MSLEDLARLSALHLNNCKIGNAALSHVKDLKALGRLDLSGTNVGDAGLACLDDLHTLWCLSLANTKITDAGLQHLKTLKLQVVCVTGCHVTDVGVADLQKALPNCEIIR